MPYSSLEIANYFIKSSQRTGVELTPMKLIKLCYIAHGWCLGLYGKELLDEAVQAWQYGPVITSVYHMFKHYGNNQITEMVRQGGSYPLPNPEINPLLDKIWEIYGKYNGVQLSTMTHQPNTPWDIMWNQRNGRNSQSTIIPNDLIKSHYREKAQSNLNVSAQPQPQ